VRLGGTYGSRVEVTAGLRAGDQVLVPALTAARE
jgi:multidrug efflux pump subunit AcrA (membrane-fusion protein)